LLDEIAENGKVTVAISQTDVLALSSAPPSPANIINLFGNLE
jgi:hypothetical protein